MQKINIISVGTLKESYLKEAQQEYLKRLGAFCDINIKECKESNVNVSKKLITEYHDMAKYIEKGYTILLDVNGRIVDSIELSNMLSGIANTHSTVNFLVGGSNGVSDILYDKCNDKISFGRITLPHQLFRIVLLEQIYRCYMIANNKVYHK